MFAFIGSIIKYSFLTVTILVLSHLIEIDGYTISQQVERVLDWASLYHPTNPAKGITEAFSRSMNGRLKEIDQIDAEEGPQDQKALNQVIERSQHRR